MKKILVKKVSELSNNKSHSEKKIRVTKVTQVLGGKEVEKNIGEQGFRAFEI